MLKMEQLPAKRGNVPLRYARGHFATNHSHINYYIDITYQKTRLGEAKDIARQLVTRFHASTVIDTILCLDGTEVIGACLAEELTKGGFRSINAHQTIYILTPEHNSNSQIIFRDNYKPMIKGKHVLVLMASMTTGFTLKRSIEAIGYYGGFVSGAAALYSAVALEEHLPITSVYTLDDLPDYQSFESNDCPYCKQGIPLDALVNSHGYSKL